MLKAYKNRILDYSKKVLVYKNLHNNLYNVKQNNKVIAQGYDFMLTNVETSINEKSRLRVIKTNTKNVHAYLVGYLANDIMYTYLKENRITYNPYVNSNFICNNEKFFNSDKVYISKDGVFNVS